jgi:hypothetical protein
VSKQRGDHASWSRDGKLEESGASSGPGTYEQPSSLGSQSVSGKSTSASMSMGRARRPQPGSLNPYVNKSTESPGPNLNIQDSIGATQKSAQGYIFGYAGQRGTPASWSRDGKLEESGPASGPGTYEQSPAMGQQPNSLKATGFSFAMGGAQRPNPGSLNPYVNRSTEGPGPNINVRDRIGATQKSAQGYIFGNEGQRGDTATWSRDKKLEESGAAVGPGTYEQATSLGNQTASGKSSSSAFAMGGAQRPNPGSLNPYVNKTTEGPGPNINVRDQIGATQKTEGGFSFGGEPTRELWSDIGHCTAMGI